MPNAPLKQRSDTPITLPASQPNLSNPRVQEIGAFHCDINHEKYSLIATTRIAGQSAEVVATGQFPMKRRVAILWRVRQRVESNSDVDRDVSRLM